MNYIGNPGGVSSMVESSTSNTNTMVGNMDSLKVHELYKELQNEKQHRQQVYEAAYILLQTKINASLIDYTTHKNN